MSTSDRELAEEFRALNSLLHADGDADYAMQRLVELASESVPGCMGAATTAWPKGRPPHSRSTTGDVALALDQLQYELGEGPCLSTADGEQPVHIASLATDTRWPAFARAAVANTPVRSVLSYQLTGEPHRLALNLYAEEPHRFDVDAFNTGVLFAAHASVLAAHADSAHGVATLTQALNTSRQIGAAIGVLMSVHKVTEDDAFQMLRTTSQHLNRKLRDIAIDVTDTGELPTNDSTP